VGLSADVLLALPIQNIPQVPDIGHIYRPASSRPDWFVPHVTDRYAIDGVKPKFTIVGPGALGDVGEVIDKVGRSTGWTRGQTLAHCSDITYGSGSLKKVIRCQVRTAVPAWLGDSGGPFFRVLTGGDGTSVEFLRMLDGVNTTNHWTWFGSWEMLQRELGPLSLN
jgi:hypothetical protein